jgi:hypothetical protein
MFFFPRVTPRDKTYRIQESIQLKSKKPGNRRERKTNRRRTYKAIEKLTYDFTRDYRSLVTQGIARGF